MIAIVKYNAGNIKSVKNSLTRLGYASVVTDDPQTLMEAEKVIFPGVGEASSAMRYLQERGLDQAIINLKQPVLGICLGMQLMCKQTEEGNTKGFGIFNSNVKRFPTTVRVPHMGWNDFTEVKDPLFQNVERSDDTYFVHGYYAEICDETIAVCDYGLKFSAALQKDNFYGVQFHPEKSATVGNKILKNFLEL